MSDEKWFYTRDWRNDDSWDGGPSASREAAIAAGRARYGADDFYVATGTLTDPEDYVPTSEEVLDLMRQALDDASVSEMPDDWPIVNEEGRRELDELLKAWAAKHCSSDAYIVDGEPECIAGAAS